MTKKNLTFCYKKMLLLILRMMNSKTRLESEMDKAIIPPESLVNGRYIIGCVFERVAKKERNNQFHNYKIAFEYAGDGMKYMVYSMKEFF